MKTTVTSFFVAAGFLLWHNAARAQFTAGNIVVSVIKSANGLIPNGTAQQRILREFSPAGVPTSKEFLLPTVASGANRRLTNSRTINYPTEGAVSLSADGRYLLVAGYDAALGTASLVTTTSSIVPRVVGRIDWKLSDPAAAIDTSTAIADGFNRDTVRTVASQDGSAFWVSGGGTNTGGVHYVTRGSTGVSTTLQTTDWDMRGIVLFSGQLYAACNWFGRQGIGKLGEGAPTEAPQTFNLLPGLSDAALRLHGFWFADANTLYVADDRSNGDPTPIGGLQKWTYDSTLTQSWSLAQTFRIVNAGNTDHSVGAYAVTGTRDTSGNTIVYVVSTDNRLLKMTDTGASPTLEVIAVAPQDEIWRGVTLLPASTNGGGNISGTITVQGCASNAIPLTFQFKTFLGTIYTQIVTPAPDGTFVTAPFPQTVGYIGVRASNTLQKVQFMNLAMGSQRNVVMTLPAGDANGDNATDISDLLLLIAHYNQANFQDNFLQAADFNRDGFNDIADLLLLIGNYNQMGQFLP